MGRTDATVNFNWGGGAPHTSLGADTFSVRWVGQVRPHYSETYTFYIQNDDGVRLWVNSNLIIEAGSTSRSPSAKGRSRLKALLAL
jgi:PA14 domain